MNAFSLLALTAESHSHSFLDALPHMAGMLMVLVSLAFLWGICALTAKIVSVAFPEKPPANPVAAPSVVPGPSGQAASAPTPTASAIPPEIVAVIAAAVATITRNEPARIVSIKPMSTSWERAGRQSVLTSHRIR